MPARPPVTDLLAYPATGGIIALCVTATLAKFQGHGIAVLTMDSQGDHATPWSYITSAFPHGDLLHLLFNVYWMWIFGTAVERTFGSFRTVGICVLFASTSAAAEFAVFDGGIGLSGVGYGLFGMLWVLSRGKGPLQHFIDERTKVTFVAWFFVCIITTMTGVMPVANVAHGAGLLEGILLGRAIVERPRRPLLVTCLATVSLVFVLAATQFRCRVNLSGTAGASIAGAGYHALESGQYEEAARLYERLLCFDNTNCAAWYNCGVAYVRLSQFDRALDAFRRARQCRPDSDTYRAGLANLLVQVAHDRLLADMNDDAYRLYSEAASLQDISASAWYNRGVACVRLGRLEEAAAAFAWAARQDPGNELYRSTRDQYSRYNK